MPQVSNAAGQSFHPATIPGQIITTQTLSQGVCYEDFQLWGFTDEEIVALKPAKPTPSRPDPLSPADIFERAGKPFPDADVG